MAATRGSLYYLLLLISSVFAITLNVLKCKFLSLSPTGLEKFLSLSEELACTALHPGHLSCKARGRSFLGSLQEWFWRVLCRCLRCSIFFVCHLTVGNPVAEAVSYLCAPLGTSHNECSKKYFLVTQKGTAGRSEW